MCVSPTRRTFGATASGFITVRTCCSSLPTTSRMTSSSHASVPAESSKLGTHSLVPPPACSEAACHNALRCRGLFGCVCGSKIGRCMACMCNATSSGHLRSTTKTRTRRGPGGIRGAPGGPGGPVGTIHGGFGAHAGDPALSNPALCPVFGQAPADKLGGIQRGSGGDPGGSGAKKGDPAFSNPTFSGGSSATNYPLYNIKKGNLMFSTLRLSRILSPRVGLACCRSV